MHIFILLVLALQAAVAQPKTMSELMIDPIYPASDAVFYISTRTPANDAEWRQLEARLNALVDAAKALAGPMYFRDRDRWMADAKLLVDASVSAADAAKRRDVNALSELNDAMYTSCVQCHQHYRPNYGRRPLPAADGAPGAAAAAAAPAASAAAAPPSPAQAATAAARAGATSRNLEGVWRFATVTPLERPAEFAATPLIGDQEAAAFEERTIERTNRDRREATPEAD